jgi:hypothetical protein
LVAIPIPDEYVRYWDGHFTMPGSEICSDFEFCSVFVVRFSNPDCNAKSFPQNIGYDTKTLIFVRKQSKLNPNFYNIGNIDNNISLQKSTFQNFKWQINSKKAGLKS